MYITTGNYSDYGEARNFNQAPILPWFSRDQFKFETFDSQADLMFREGYKMSLVSKMRIFIVMLFVIVLPSIIAFVTCLYKERKRKRAELLKPLNDERWQALTELGLPTTLMRKSAQLSSTYGCTHSIRTSTVSLSKPRVSIPRRGNHIMRFMIYVNYHSQ
uniref:Uncharacterized protein n=1 Tax=Ciona savignyi TaxID=51511 RepID=H2ZJ50_CIOSA